jgi:hypothetical protein
MNNGLLNYQLHSFSGLMASWANTTFVRDTEDDLRTAARLDIEAQVRSGDYFVTLATKLDTLSSDAVEYNVRAGVEDIVSDLIYLQDNYDVTKKQTLIKE